MAELTDIQLECKDCHQKFDFPVRDQEFYAAQGYESPKRCRACRNKRKAKNQKTQKER